MSHQHLSVWPRCEDCGKQQQLTMRQDALDEPIPLCNNCQDGQREVPNTVLRLTADGRPIDPRYTVTYCDNAARQIPELSEQGERDQPRSPPRQGSRSNRQRDNDRPSVDVYWPTPRDEHRSSSYSNDNRRGQGHGDEHRPGHRDRSSSRRPDSPRHGRSLPRAEPLPSDQPREPSTVPTVASSTTGTDQSVKQPEQLSERDLYEVDEKLTDYCLYCSQRFHKYPECTNPSHLSNTIKNKPLVTLEWAGFNPDDLDPLIAELSLWDGPKAPTTAMGLHERGLYVVYGLHAWPEHARQRDQWFLTHRTRLVNTLSTCKISQAMAQDVIDKWDAFSITRCAFSATYMAAISDLVENKELITNSLQWMKAEGTPMHNVLRDIAKIIMVRVRNPTTGPREDIAPLKDSQRELFAKRLDSQAQLYIEATDMWYQCLSLYLNDFMFPQQMNPAARQILVKAFVALGYGHVTISAAKDSWGRLPTFADLEDIKTRFARSAMEVEPISGAPGESEN